MKEVEQLWDNMESVCSSPRNNKYSPNTFELPTL